MSRLRPPAPPRGGGAHAAWPTTLWNRKENSVDAITLLAEPATPARHLDTEDGRFRLGVHIYDHYEDTYLHVRSYLRDLSESPHFHVLLDRDAAVHTTAVAETDA